MGATTQQRLGKPLCFCKKKMLCTVQGDKPIKDGILLMLKAHGSMGLKSTWK